MREYGKVSPRLWTGRVGKALRGDAHGQALAAYLVTGPHANLAGLYHLPLAYVAADLGHPERRIAEAMNKLETLGYARYDAQNERVWVIEHLRHELGGTGEMKAGDNRRRAIEAILADHAISPLAKGLAERYAIPFEGASKGLEGGLESPYASQEQEQEQEQEQDTERACARVATAMPEQSEAEKKSEAEIRWRVDRVWQDHLRAWRAFCSRRNGSKPSQDPTFHPTDIAKPIRAAILLHDREWLGGGQRNEWIEKSKARAAGVGIFYSRWHTGADERSNGQRYLEHWRPWKPQRGKADPVPGFAELYFAEREGGV